MYLQKREEYTGGELTGADPDDNPYKGIVCFMIAGLKENVLVFLKDVPETGVTETRWNLRLQYDPLERRYCHYRQMSGGNLLVSEGNETFWKIIKLKSLMEENIVWNQALTTRKKKT